jgi:hypothetical protein
MLITSALPSFAGLTDQLFSPATAGLDKAVTDDPYVDKVYLSSGQPEQDFTYDHLLKRRPAVSSESGNEPEAQQKAELERPESSDRLAALMQQVLDAKMGVDRKKLEEIDEKIQALLNKEGPLTDAEKAQLEMLQKQKEQLIKEGAKKLTEEEN